MPRKITIPATVRRYYRDYGSLSLCEPSRTRGEKKKKKTKKERKKRKRKKKVHLSERIKTLSDRDGGVHELFSEIDDPFGKSRYWLPFPRVVSRIN